MVTFNDQNSEPKPGPVVLATPTPEPVVATVTVTTPASVAASDLPMTNEKIDVKKWSNPSRRILRVGGGLNLIDISAQDPSGGGAATIGSKLNYDLGLGYKYFFHSGISLGASVDLNIVNYENTGEIAIIGYQAVLMRARMEGTIRLIKNVRLVSIVNYTQRSFLHAINSTQIQIDTIGGFGMGLGLSWQFLEYRKYQFSLVGSGGYLFPFQTANYTTDAGTTFTVSGNISYQFNQKQFVELIPYFRADQQNTSILTASSAEAGVKINYGFTY